MTYSKPTSRNLKMISNIVAISVKFRWRLSKQKKKILMSPVGPMCRWITKQSSVVAYYYYYYHGIMMAMVGP